MDTAILIDTLGWAEVDTVLYDRRWFKIQGSFTPVDASIRFITIGNFFDAAHTDTIRITTAWPRIGHGIQSLYLIDDVSVVRSDAHAYAEPDTVYIRAAGDSVWIGNDTAAVGGGDGMPCWWYVLSSSTAIDSGGRILVHPDSTTTYVMKMELCGNVTYDTVTVNVWPLGVTSPYPLGRGNISVWPNPAGEVLHIDNVPLHTRYVIVNLIGQKMLEGEIQDKTINIQTLQPGMYFIEFSDEWGDRRVLKFIKM